MDKTKQIKRLKLKIAFSHVGLLLGAAIVVGGAVGFLATVMVGPPTFGASYGLAMTAALIGLAGMFFAGYMDDKIKAASDELRRLQTKSSA